MIRFSTATERRVRLAVGVVMVIGAWACGKKGDPLPPLRPVPSAAAGFSIERAGTAVTLRFTVPETNVDGSTPASAERVDLFGLSKAADAPAPTAAELLQPANLLKSIAVRPQRAAAAAASARAVRGGRLFHRARGHRRDAAVYRAGNQR